MCWNIKYAHITFEQNPNVHNFKVSNRHNLIQTLIEKQSVKVLS